MKSRLAGAKRRFFARLSAAACLAAGLASNSCSPIQLEDTPAADRRVYVNDRAANDSLSPDLLRRGVKFVLQPGKPYVFSVTTARTSDQLDVSSYQGGLHPFKKIPATHDGARQLYAIVSPLTTAQFYMAKLVTKDQAPLSAIQGVSLVSQDTLRVDTLKVKLLFMQTLQGLPTDASKNAFANSFFVEMNSVLKPFGIVVSGMVEVVDPTAKALVFPFSNLYVSLAGTRTPNHAHLYLVDSISVGDPGTGPQGEVLGFAPREVVDISDHRESRVILANRASISRLAVTAAHELGHFFGLRHTISTRHDKLQDDDASNVEDGFGDTRFCTIDQAFLGKLGTAGFDSADRGPRRGPDAAGPYCLRIADDACSNTDCDRNNLMHPVECGGMKQTTLTAEQANFLKRNLALYRR